MGEWMEWMVLESPGVFIDFWEKSLKSARGLRNYSMSRPKSAYVCFGGSFA